MVGLEKRCTELETAASVEDGLLNSLYHRFRSKEWATEELDNATAAKQAQHKLGWRQIFNGQIATAWADAQDGFYRDEGRWGTSKNGRVRTVSILSHIWEEWFKLWDCRNALVHGSDKESRARVQREVIERRIEALCAR